MNKQRWISLSGNRAVTIEAITRQQAVAKAQLVHGRTLRPPLIIRISPPRPT